MEEEEERESERERERERERECVCVCVRVCVRVCVCVRESEIVSLPIDSCTLSFSFFLNPLLLSHSLAQYLTHSSG